MDRHYRRPQIALFHPYFIWTCQYTRVTMEEATKEIWRQVLVKLRERREVVHLQEQAIMMTKRIVWQGRN